MRKKPWNTVQVKKVVLAIVIYVLDFLLTMMLLPYTIWEWFSKGNPLLAILRATFEVNLSADI